MVASPTRSSEPDTRAFERSACQFGRPYLPSRDRKGARERSRCDNFARNERRIERVGGEQLDEMLQREYRAIQNIRRPTVVGPGPVPKEVDLKGRELAQPFVRARRDRMTAAQSITRHGGRRRLSGRGEKRPIGKIDCTISNHERPVDAAEQSLSCLAHT